MRSLVLILPIGIAAHVTHMSFNDVDLEQPHSLHQTLPSAEALRFLSLTYEPLVADYYWLKTINEFGDIRKHQAHYPNLIALTRRTLSLDPYFETGYLFAGTALTVRELDPQTSVELLEQGRHHRPDVWRIPFYLGFNYYYFLGDFARAAEAMAAAAEHPDAPPIAGQLATRLASQAGQPELGIRMIDSILENVEDETLRAEYLQRRELLVVRMHLKWLDQAIAVVRERTGKCPESIGELLESGAMRGIPQDPLGGTYGVEDCRATTTSQYEELRVHGPTGVSER